VPITRKTGAIQALIAFDATLSSWWTKIVLGALRFVLCVVRRAMGGRSRQ
jgi:simple sugar transport system permease protein